MIGAIVLTHRAPKGDVRPQNISQQVRRRPQDATRNVTDQPIGAGVEL